MTTIAERVQAVRRDIEGAVHAVGRPAGSVHLLAVSKTHSPDRIREAYVAGQRAFGENYLQEALDKMPALTDLGIEWHFIGPIQSNKTRAIAEHFDWVHGIDRLKIAQRLSDARPSDMAPLNVCIQVNVSGEESKSGCAPDEILELALQVARLPGLHLRGLMAIPEPTQNVGLQHSRCRMLAELKAQLNAEGLVLDTLSMGMSDDYAAAIAEGATIVRIGTAIFGERRVASSE